MSIPQSPPPDAGEGSALYLLVLLAHRGSRAGSVRYTTAANTE